MSKKGFCGLFRKTPGKRFTIFIVSLQLNSNWQDSLPLECIRCTKNEKGNFLRKNLCFGPKNSKKWFFGVFRYVLEQFAVLLCHTRNAQNHKVAAYLDALGVETKSRHICSEKNCVLRRRTSKEGVFLQFSGLHSNASNYFVCIRWCSNSQISRPFNCTRCCNNIKGNFKAEIFVLGQRKNSKKGFFWGSQVCFTFSLHKSNEFEIHEIGA